MRLRKYLDENGIAVAAFAATIDVTVQALHRYMAGERIPRKPIMERIEQATSGRVQPNDFFSGREAA